MDDVQTIIHPLNNGLGGAHYVGIGLFFLLCILMFALYKPLILKDNSKYRALFSMICGLAMMILGSTLFLNQLNASKLGDIIFEKDSMQFRGRSLKYDNMKHAFIEPTYQKSRYDSQLNKDTIYMGVLEMKNKKTYIFSEENYELEALIGAIRTRGKLK